MSELQRPQNERCHEENGNGKPAVENGRHSIPLPSPSCYPGLEANHRRTTGSNQNPEEDDSRSVATNRRTRIVFGVHRKPRRQGQRVGVGSLSLGMCLSGPSRKWQSFWYDGIQQCTTQRCLGQTDKLSADRFESAVVEKLIEAMIRQPLETLADRWGGEVDSRIQWRNDGNCLAGTLSWRASCDGKSLGVSVTLAHKPGSFREDSDQKTIDVDL